MPHPVYCYLFFGITFVLSVKCLLAADCFYDEDETLKRQRQRQSNNYTTNIRSSFEQGLQLYSVKQLIIASCISIWRYLAEIKLIYFTFITSAKEVMF